MMPLDPEVVPEVDPTAVAGKAKIGAPSASGIIDAGMGLATAAAPMLKSIKTNKLDRMGEKGNLTHKVNTVGNITSMASAGAKAGAMFGPIGGAIGAIGGAQIGAIASLIDGKKQPTMADMVAERNKFNVNQQTQSIASNDTFAQQGQAAAKGLKDVSNAKQIEVEKNEIVLRKTGNSFKKVADFKGGKSHAQGGEDYVASEGDIIIPGKKRLAVDKALRTRDWKHIESIRQSLPVDNGQSSFKEGTKGVSPYTKEGIDAQNHIYNRLVEAGLSENAAKGIVVNLSYESSNFTALEETGKNIHGTKGLGIAQWTDGPKAKRRTAFEAFLKERDSTAGDLDANVDFLISELKGEQDYNVGSSIDSFNENSATVEEASKHALTKYERPANQSDAHNKVRVKNSEGFLKQESIPTTTKPQDPNIGKNGVLRKPQDPSIGKDGVLAPGAPTPTTPKKIVSDYPNTGITQEQLDFENEMKSGDLPYWNSQSKKGKAVRKYKETREEGTMKKMYGKDGPYGGGAIEDVADFFTSHLAKIAIGSNTKERLTNTFGDKKQYRELQEVGFEKNDPRSNKIKQNLTSLYGDLASKGAGNMLLSVGDALGAITAGVVTGQDRDGAYPNIIGNMLSWYKPEEVEKILADQRKKGTLDPWTEHIVKDAYNNPEKWYTKDMQTGMEFDIATILANPKGMFQLVKGGAKLVSATSKTGVSAAKALAKLVKSSSLKKSVNLIKKAVNRLGEVANDGYKFESTEDINDILNAYKKADEAGIAMAPAAVESRGVLKRTSEVLKRIPDKLRSNYMGKSYKEMERLNSNLTEMTGKSFNELQDMSRTDVSKILKSKVDEVANNVANLAEEKTAAMANYKTLKADYTSKVAKLKEGKNLAKDPIEIRRMENELEEVTANLKDAGDQIKKAVVKQEGQLEQMSKMEGFMASEEYGDKFRVVMKLEKEFNRQSKLFDASDEVIAGLSNKKLGLSDDAWGLHDKISGGRKNYENFMEYALDVKDAKKAKAEGLTAQQSAVAKHNMASGRQAGDEAAAIDKLKDFPKVFKALEEDANMMKMYRSGERTLAQVIAAINLTERDSPDEQLRTELDAIKEVPEVAATDEVAKKEDATRKVEPSASEVSAGDVIEPTPEGLTIPTGEEIKAGSTPKIGKEKSDSGVLTKIGGGLETLASYAPAIYNIVKGLEDPEKIARRFVTPQTKNYENLSQPQLNLIEDAYATSIGNARNTSGGMMSNFRANTEKAWADKIARTGQVNAEEANRSNQIANENVGIRNQAEQYNAQVNSQADQVDMQSAAATNSFLAQGMKDVADITTRNKRDALAQRNQDMMSKMVSSGRPYTFNPETGEMTLNQSMATPAAAVAPQPKTTTVPINPNYVPSATPVSPTIGGVEPSPLELNLIDPNTFRR
jgi:hypothetical protein